MMSLLQEGNQLNGQFTDEELAAFEEAEAADQQRSDDLDPERVEAQVDLAWDVLYKSDNTQQ